MGGAGSGLFGVVASQIILDNPRSIGDMAIANRYSARNAIANMNSIPAETRIASRMTDINAPIESVISSNYIKLYTMV